LLDDSKSLLFVRYFNDGKKDTSDKLALSKKKYAVKRGSTYSSNKNSSKVKNSLKILEDELKTKKIVYCDWSDSKSINLMLSNGLLVFLEIDCLTGDIERVSFDKYFVQKIVNENINDGKLTIIILQLS
jgi:WD repeat-containing and planar cell polarity effector protein